VREKSVVPPGLESLFPAFPGAEAPGYWQSSLRDLKLLIPFSPALKRWANPKASSRAYSKGHLILEGCGIAKEYSDTKREGSELHFS
jgi:hypothetical protein